MSSYVPLTSPEADLDADGRLRSARYGDVYHSAAGALGQAEHVFLRGNGLPGRWRGRDAFTVCETGFGLGLNFLARSEERRVGKECRSGGWREQWRSRQRMRGRRRRQREES